MSWIQLRLILRKFGDLFNKKTTCLDWHKWQLEALENDANIENRVTLLLDGFDEIKDPVIIEKLGKWIKKLDKETKLLIIKILRY